MINTCNYRCWANTHDLNLIDANRNCQSSCPITTPFWKYDSVVNLINTNVVVVTSHRYTCVAECPTNAVDASMMCYPWMPAVAPVLRAIPGHTTQLMKFSVIELFNATNMAGCALGFVKTAATTTTETCTNVSSCTTATFGW